MTITNYSHPNQLSSTLFFSASSSFPSLSAFYTISKLHLICRLLLLLLMLLGLSFGSIETERRWDFADALFFLCSELSLLPLSHCCHWANSDYYTWVEKIGFLDTLNFARYRNEGRYTGRECRLSVQFSLKIDFPCLNQNGFSCFIFAPNIIEINATSAVRCYTLCWSVACVLFCTSSSSGSSSPLVCLLFWSLSPLTSSSSPSLS